MSEEDFRARSVRAEETSSEPFTTNPSQAKHTVVSMFAGCGGMDLGFTGGFRYRNVTYTKQPFSIVGAYDNDTKCKRTYDKNFPHELTLLDLSNAHPCKLPKADLLIGGFPCQEFSSCGPQGGIDSHRGSLFKAMTRYARHHKPMLVIAENVPNLARINGGSDLTAIRQAFSRAGYRTILWSIYAPDYGVPQARGRLIIVAVRKDLPADPVLPRPKYAKSPRSIEWAISDLIEVIDDSVPNQSQYFRAGLAKNGHGQGDEINSAEAPAYTIRANSRSRVQFHYLLPRRLTVRECARIQTFPDTFVFPDEATPSIRQIGNAVPPMLAHMVATEIAAFIAKQKYASGAVWQ